MENNNVDFRTIATAISACFLALTGAVGLLWRELRKTDERVLVDLTDCRKRLEESRGDIVAVQRELAKVQSENASMRTRLQLLERDDQTNKE